VIVKENVSEVFAVIIFETLTFISVSYYFLLNNNLSPYNAFIRF